MPLIEVTIKTIKKVREAPAEREEEGEGLRIFLSLQAPGPCRLG